MGARRQLELILADAHTFVLSAEVSKAIAAVTVDQLIQEAIDRNGDSETSKTTKFDPYAIDISQPPTASERPLEQESFVSGSNLSGATKIDRIHALRAELRSTVEEVKKMPLSAVQESDRVVDDSRDSIFAEFEAEEFDSEA